MLSQIRDQQLFGATASLWLLFAFTALFHLSSAAPQQLIRNALSRRADAPGIGVELEMPRIVVQGKDNKDLTAENKEKVKGAEMIPIGFAGSAKTNWKLTTEIGGQTGLLPEAIVDGLKNKVGEGKTKVIGAEIFKFFKDWAPCRGGTNCKVTIKNHDDFGPWTVYWPKDMPVDLSDEKSKFGAQVTTAMPLQAVLKILSDASNGNAAKNLLASSGSINMKNIKILTKKDFDAKSFPNIKQSDINDEFLGYFSLLTSYCVLADTSNKKEGPKRILPIMPRTDFVTQYTKFIEPKLKAQLAVIGKDKKPTTSLYDIIEKVSGSKPGELAKKKFVWNPVITTKITETWTDKDADLKAGTLEVQKFLNYVQGFDKVTNNPLTKMDLVKLMDKTLRHGQIGGLGSKMEPLVGKTDTVPIFEFRDLEKIFGADLEKTLGAYEDKVIAYHKEKPKRSVDALQETDMLQEE